MRYASKLKNLLFLLLLTGVFFQFFFSKTVNADSAGNLNFCSIGREEVKKAIDGCSIKDLEGFCGNAFDSVQKIFSADFSVPACICDKDPKFCQTGTNTDGGYAPSQLETYLNSNQGIVSLVGNANSTILAQRPASGINYLEEKVYALTNPGKVYAQDEPSTYYPGAGADLLKPVQGFWGWAVNFVYGFLILLIMVIAFRIMFSNTSGGKETVTLQNAIPSIALAMILVPLSYSISGLFIDGITLGSNAVHGFMFGPASPARQVYEDRVNTPTGTAAQDVGVGKADAGDRGYYIDDPRVDVFRARERIDLREQGSELGQSLFESNPITNNGLFLAISNILNGLLSTDSSAPNATSQYAWLGNIINAVISIATIYIALKIAYRLFGKYITLLFYPIISPFIFATMAIPGTGTKNIIEYCKQLGSASLFYIVTYAMFLMTIIFTSRSFQDAFPDFRTAGYVPPLLGFQGILASLTNQGNTNLTRLMFTLIGLGIYFSIPSVLDSIDKSLGTEFKIPAFINTPVNAFRESAGATYGFATRTAPAIVGRSANIIRNSPNLIKNPVINTSKALANTPVVGTKWRNDRTDRADDAAGFTQNTPGTRRYKVKDGLDKQWAEVYKQYQSAFNSGNTSQAARLKNEMNKLDEKAKGEGVSLSHSLKSEDKVKLMVRHDPKPASYPVGSGNAVLFPQDLIASIANDFISIAPTKDNHTINIGSLVFSGQGEGFPPLINGQIQIKIGVSVPLDSTTDANVAQDIRNYEGKYGEVRMSNRADPIVVPLSNYQFPPGPKGRKLDKANIFVTKVGGSRADGREYTADIGLGMSSIIRPSTVQATDFIEFLFGKNTASAGSKPLYRGGLFTGTSQVFASDEFMAILIKDPSKTDDIIKSEPFTIKFTVS